MFRYGNKVPSEASKWMLPGSEWRRWPELAH